MDEGKVDDIEFVEAGEDAAEAFEPPEERLDLIVFAVDGLVVPPWFQAVALGRRHGNKAKSKASCRTVGDPYLLYPHPPSKIPFAYVLLAVSIYILPGKGASASSNMCI